ncbi:MAG: cytochrome c3 family protein [Acidobacteria bacterium]|nr:cytochrome c3 family protein [Acidobacteriota bacterium]
MKKVLIICLAVLVTAVMANAQTVVGTPHDLSATGPGATTNVSRVCVFCHTPHQASAAAGQYPLWNHTLSSTASYGVYSSPTLNASPTDIGGATAGSAAVSNLCMSCHDGTVSVASMYNPPNEVSSVTLTAGGNVTSAGLITGTPDLGTDLSDDHPINFTYDTALATADGGLNDPATDTAVADLLIGGEVQCSSCHNPHDNTYEPFLVKDNTGSALCTTCHIK